MSNLYCYLESSNIVNEKLYNSLGFVHRQVIRFTRGDAPVELDVMTRAPQGGTGSVASGSLDFGGEKI